MIDLKYFVDLTYLNLSKYSDLFLKIEKFKWLNFDFKGIS